MTFSPQLLNESLFVVITRMGIKRSVEFLLVRVYVWYARRELMTCTMLMILLDLRRRPS
jgi:hypothetical protein